jgi:hypothetical protein
LSCCASLSGASVTCVPYGVSPTAKSLPYRQKKSRRVDDPATALALLPTQTRLRPWAYMLNVRLPRRPPRLASHAARFRSDRRASVRCRNRRRRWSEAGTEMTLTRADAAATGPRFRRRDNMLPIAREIPAKPFCKGNGSLLNPARRAPLPRVKPHSPATTDSIPYEHLGIRRRCRTESGVGFRCNSPRRSVHDRDTRPTV